MAQDTLGGHHDEWLPKAAFDLPPKQVKVLRRGARVADLKIIFRAQLQVAFKAGTGMLGPLPFKPVREQQHQAVQTSPFGLSRSQVLVDDYLGIVGEITKLRFPDHQGMRTDTGIAVFEAENRLFRQHTVVNHKRCLILTQGLQRREALTGLGVHQHTVPLAEGAPTAVFAAQTHRCSFIQKGGEGQHLRTGPINILTLPDGFQTPFQNALQARMKRESFGINMDFFRQAEEKFARNPGRYRFMRVGAVKPLPVVKKLHEGRHARFFLRRSVSCLQALGNPALNPVAFLLGDHPCCDQFLSVNSVGRGTILDPFVHLRLGVIGFIRFAVTIAAVADHIDHHIFGKLASVVGSQLDHLDHSFRILAVDVEDRHHEHLGDISGIPG